MWCSRSDRTAPEFLAVGHVSLDVITGVQRPAEACAGGAAAYAAVTAQRLGLRAGIVTSAGPDFLFERELPGIAVCSMPADTTTAFHNHYGPGGRSQTLTKRAPSIQFDNVPEHWRSPRILLLAPIAGEVPLDAPSWFTAGMAGASLQGWVRRWDDEGRISVDPAPLAFVGPLDLVIGAEDEVTPDNGVPWAATPVVAVTRGDMGARLYTGGQWTDVPAFPATEVDATGAGDVWAAAFVVCYAETGDAMRSAVFANGAAAISIEAPGLTGIRGRPEIAQRIGRATGRSQGPRHEPGEGATC